jgi:hypothetical protein
MKFQQEEIKILSGISQMLLQRLEPEPLYVKEYIEKECEKLQKEGWHKQENREFFVKTFTRETYTLKIAFVHARKGEHITGADLVFELEDKKVIFIQSKKVSPDGRIHFNRFQLQKLIELEGQICGLFPFYKDIYSPEGIDIMYEFYHRFEELYRYKHFPFATVLPFFLPYYLPFRATFYHLIMRNQQGIEEKFFPVLEIFFTLGNNKSVSQKEFLGQGLKPDEFKKLFWECKIGGPDIREDIKKEILYFYSLFTNRFIIWLEIEKK